MILLQYILILNYKLSIDNNLFAEQVSLKIYLYIYIYIYIYMMMMMMMMIMMMMRFINTYHRCGHPS